MMRCFGLGVNQIWIQQVVESNLRKTNFGVCGYLKDFGSQTDDLHVSVCLLLKLPTSMGVMNSLLKTLNIKKQVWNRETGKILHFY